MESMIPLSDPSVNGHMVDMVQAFHSCTWFSMDRVPGVTRTTKGVQAGTPVADLIFAAAMTVLLRTIRGKIQHHE